MVILFYVISLCTFFLLKTGNCSNVPFSMLQMAYLEGFLYITFSEVLFHTKLVQKLYIEIRTEIITFTVQDKH